MNNLSKREQFDKFRVLRRNMLMATAEEQASGMKFAKQHCISELNARHRQAAIHRSQAKH